MLKVDWSRREEGAWRVRDPIEILLIKLVREEEIKKRASRQIQISVIGAIGSRTLNLAIKSPNS